jgi:hypothetical protein
MDLSGEKGAGETTELRYEGRRSSWLTTTDDIVYRLWVMGLE